jgi:hypothetical protein
MVAWQHVLGASPNHACTHHQASRPSFSLKSPLTHTMGINHAAHVCRVWSGNELRERDVHAKKRRKKKREGKINGYGLHDHF